MARASSPDERTETAPARTDGRVIPWPAGRREGRPPILQAAPRRLPPGPRAAPLELVAIDGGAGRQDAESAAGGEAACTGGGAGAASRRRFRAPERLRPPRVVFCDAAPMGRLQTPFALPPALPSHPEICRGDAAGFAPPPDPARIRAEALFWPAVRHDALRAAAALVLPPVIERAPLLRLLGRARRRLGEPPLVIAQGRAARWAEAEGCRVAPSPAHLRPEGLEALIAPLGAPVLLWAQLAGLEAWAATTDRAGAGGARGFGGPPADARAVLGALGAGPLRMGREPVRLRRLPERSPWAERLQWRDPWTGARIDAEAGLDALAALRAGAEANPRRVVTAGLSRWKRRAAAPFLTGPCGPPLHRRDIAAAAALAERIGGRVAVWSDAPLPEALRIRAPLRLEDGFLRSVGLGLRHVPPASLCAAVWGLHFDAARIGDLERLAKAGAAGPALRARGARLRARIVAGGLSKYNLPGPAALPPTRRERVLVAGQVENDASLRLGATGIRTNLELLRAARARAPDAFLVWRPHPDVETGLRPGRVPAEQVAALADFTASDATVEACLDWADRVECITSLIGFEALLRGRKVSVHGRPFYAGWGLTEELSPPAPHPVVGAFAAEQGGERAPEPPFHRGMRLDLDALTGLALVRGMRCIDPRTRLPAPPERLLDALEAERAAAGTLRARLLRVLRLAWSEALNRVG